MVLISEAGSLGNSVSVRERKEHSHFGGILCRLEKGNTSENRQEVVGINAIMIETYEYVDTSVSETMKSTNLCCEPRISVPPQSKDQEANRLFWALSPGQRPLPGWKVGGLSFAAGYVAYTISLFQSTPENQRRSSEVLWERELELADRPLGFWLWWWQATPFTLQTLSVLVRDGREWR